MDSEVKKKAGAYDVEATPLSPYFTAKSSRLITVTYDADTQTPYTMKYSLPDGIYFYIISPYRSYDHQYSLYHRYLANDTQANVDTYSARPGNSEHQLGLAADIMSSGYDFGTFYMAPAAKWLQDNAYKYGFIFRYPESKIDIKGYKYEPWHYRYVGDIAEDVYKSGVTYDEYFEKYIK